MTTKSSAITETLGTELAFMLLHFQESKNRAKTKQKPKKTLSFFCQISMCVLRESVVKREREREKLIRVGNKHSSLFTKPQN